MARRHSSWTEVEVLAPFDGRCRGFWIENGKLAFPVTEINVSGRMGEMLAAVDAVGDDLAWFGSMAAPTVRLREMTVSGL